MPSPLGLALSMQPQPAPERPGTVAPTNVLGAYQLSAQMAQQQYQEQLQQQQALWGGLAGLGSAAALGILGGPAGSLGSMLGGKIMGFLSPSSGASAGSPLQIAPTNALDNTMLGYYAG